MGKVTWEIYRYKVVKGVFNTHKEAVKVCKKRYGDDWDGRVYGEASCIISRIETPNPHTRHSFTEVKNGI